VGPIKIEKTKVVAENVMVAKLSGASEATVAVVRKDPENYHIVAPKELGGTRKVPADSMTDCLHQAVFEMSDAVSKSKKRGGKKP
jgi:hypothetical protein